MFCRSSTINRAFLTSSDEYVSTVCLLGIAHMYVRICVQLIKYDIIYYMYWTVCNLVLQLMTSVSIGAMVVQYSLFWSTYVEETTPTINGTSFNNSTVGSCEYLKLYTHAGLHDIVLHKVMLDVFGFSLHPHISPLGNVDYSCYSQCSHCCTPPGMRARDCTCGCDL